MRGIFLTTPATGVGLPGYLNFSARQHYHKNRRKIGVLETEYLPISSGKWGGIFLTTPATGVGSMGTRLFKFLVRGSTTTKTDVK